MFPFVVRQRVTSTGSLSNRLSTHRGLSHRALDFRQRRVHDVRVKGQWRREIRPVRSGCQRPASVAVDDGNTMLSQLEYQQVKLLAALRRLCLAKGRQPVVAGDHLAAIGGAAEAAQPGAGVRRADGDDMRHTWHPLQRRAARRARPARPCCGTPARAGGQLPQSLVQQPARSCGRIHQWSQTPAPGSRPQRDAHVAAGAGARASRCRGCRQSRGSTPPRIAPA
jgi:hypothetical protein